jgi:hypothetical protein
MYISLNYLSLENRNKIDTSIIEKCTVPPPNIYLILLPSSTLFNLFSQFDFEMRFVCKVALDVYISPAAALSSPRIKLFGKCF